MISEDDRTTRLIKAQLREYEAVVDAPQILPERVEALAILKKGRAAGLPVSIRMASGAPGRNARRTASTKGENTDLRPLPIRS